MAQNYSYPSSSQVTISGIGDPTGIAVPGNAVFVAGEDPAGNLRAIHVDSNGDIITSPSTSASTVTVVQPTGTNLHAVIDASALPIGAATSALQTTGNASLSSISSSTTAISASLTAKLSGSLVPTAFDEVDLTYITSGNGTGQIGVAEYKLATVLVKTLTLTYDASNRLSTVVAS